jgi:hypothetical protein
LEGVGFLEQKKVLDAQRRFARVVETWSELGARIAGIRPLHARRKHGCRLWLKWIALLFGGVRLGGILLGCVLLWRLLLRSGRGGLLRFHPAYAGK